MQCNNQNGVNGINIMQTGMFLLHFFLLQMYAKRRKPKRMLGVTLIERQPGGKHRGESGKTNLAGFAGAIYELLIAEYRPGREESSALACCKNHNIQVGNASVSSRSF